MKQDDDQEKRNLSNDDSDFLNFPFQEDTSHQNPSAYSEEEWSWERAMEAPKTQTSEPSFFINYEDLFGEAEKTERLSHLFQRDHAMTLESQTATESNKIHEPSSDLFALPGSEQIREAGLTHFIPHRATSTHNQEIVSDSFENKEADWDSYENLAHHGSPVRFSVNLWKLALYGLSLGVFILGVYKQTSHPTQRLIEQADQKLKSIQLNLDDQAKP